MYTIERIKDSSPLGIYLSSEDGRSVKINLPMPLDALNNPLELKGQAGLVKRADPGFSDFCKCRKQFVSKITIEDFNIDLNLNVFRWWGNWFVETEIPEPSSAQYESENDSPEHSKDFLLDGNETDEISRLKGSGPKSMPKAPLRVLELSIGEQKWFLIEALQPMKSDKPKSMFEYALFAGEGWVQTLVTSDNNRIACKLEQSLSGDTA